jgi:hypothetical protein
MQSILVGFWLAPFNLHHLGWRSGREPGSIGHVRCGLLQQFRFRHDNEKGGLPAGLLVVDARVIPDLVGDGRRA